MENLSSTLPAADKSTADLAGHPAWLRLKAAVEAMRPLQSKDGSIDLNSRGASTKDEADAQLAAITAAIGELAPLFPHDKAYLDAVVLDLMRWAASGYAVPDFLDSLLAFQPAEQRVDGLAHLVVFPMYTQNGNPDRNLEAVLLHVVWPEWLSELERTRYDNPMFVPITFVDFTAGYDTNSAVLFPETVSVREVPERFTWGGIFCDREAARFRAVSNASVNTLGLTIPEDAAALLADQELAQQTFVLWDLVHDRTHSHGDLPFDPFMIKQRSPFWMYGLEELRCDLTAFKAAVELEAEGNEHGRNVQYAILFDRMFRFPVSGGRVRNYDGLGGQLLFAYLHKHDALRWTDNKLHIDWQRAPQVTNDLCAEIEKLYRDGIDRPKTAHWLAAYELVATYLTPHPASTWAKGAEALPFAQHTEAKALNKALCDAVLPDEFPLSMFFEALSKKLSGVIASTSGMTGTTVMENAA
ncbi:DUF6421 family protein [Streptacidiphilus jiangxiensis]|uniref:Uncharacterized protein n=1 Tax=Streptacidiphilus jiangxiensis TaxID=235985 RepID=A0A1H7X091_STRJI|nr:DUF6421 family protein [Streptacidiphilus jiangxiensis]SEM27260.1 hypothetical protein SAMN05414137_12251 [Streptacidiphilus jiangxiensis]